MIKKNAFYLQVATSSSKQRFEANLFREESRSTKHSQKPERIFDKEGSLSLGKA